jgi:uncharacterized protein
MSCALDVNLLLYASDASSPHHAKAKAFLEICMRGTDAIYIGWPTIMSYLRMASHPAIFREPLSPEEAAANVDAILRLPNVTTLSEADGFWDVYRQVTGTVPTLLRQHGIRRIATHDRDFRKYDFLDVIDPLAAP